MFHKIDNTINTTAENDDWILHLNTPPSPFCVHFLRVTKFAFVNSTVRILFQYSQWKLHIHKFFCLIQLKFQRVGVQKQTLICAEGMRRRDLTVFLAVCIQELVSMNCFWYMFSFFQLCFESNLAIYSSHKIANRAMLQSYTRKTLSTSCNNIAIFSRWYKAVTHNILTSCWIAEG